MSDRNLPSHRDFLYSLYLCGCLGKLELVLTDDPGGGGG